MSGTMINTLLT